MVAEIVRELTDNSELESEIECPSCHSFMTLSSIYDSPYYSCDDPDHEGLLGMANKFNLHFATHDLLFLS